MDRIWSALAGLARGIPYLSLLTAILYVAGRDYNSHYWRAIGLPLMATDRPLVEMLYDGFMGCSFWLASFLRMEASPLLAAMVFAVVCRVLYSSTRLAGDWLERWLIRRAARPRKPTFLYRSIGRFIGRMLAGLDYVISAVAPLALFVMFTSTAMLIALLPAVAAGQQGAIVGQRSYGEYEAKVRQLRDGLVDVSIVTVREADNDQLVRAIPIECAGDRCAAMTDRGPVSLPKDHLIEELVAKAELTDSCWTSEGLRSRNQHRESQQ